MTTTSEERKETNKALYEQRIIASQYASRLQCLRYQMNVYIQNLKTLLDHTYMDACGEMQTNDSESLHECQLAHDAFMVSIREFQQYREGLRGVYEPQKGM